MEEELIPTIDDYRARLLKEFCGEKLTESEGEILLSMVRELSQRNRSGDICLDLNQLEIDLNGSQATHDFLSKLELVGDGSQLTPLILKDNRLYFKRYFDYEQTVGREIRKRNANFQSFEPDSKLLELTGNLFTDTLSQSQTNEAMLNSTVDDRQLQAALMACGRNFMVLCGGPGTGKTTTILKVLALKLQLAAQMRIALATPTGKAARRLADSIRSSLSSLNLPETIAERIPQNVSTLHRLLGRKPGGAGYRHNRSNQLPVDLLVIDEASMVDLSLLARTLEALPENAGLILVGDHHQLASVEAGAALGDIVKSGGAKSASRNINIGELLSEKPKSIGDSIVILNKNYRFKSESGIATLSQKINIGDATGAVELLKSNEYSDLDFCSEKSELEAELIVAICEGFESFCAAEKPVEYLAALDEFRILCALRKGLRGVENLNRFISSSLVKRGLLKCDHYRQPIAWPIMIKQNDYRLNLFNGDNGVMINDKSGRHASFLSDDGVISYPQAVLPDFETAFAMTVHKSQGSEFNRVALLLPEKSAPILTRELLYTAITRARNSFELYGAENVLTDSIQQTIERVSGLQAEFESED